MHHKHEKTSTHCHNDRLENEHLLSQFFQFVFPRCKRFLDCQTIFLDRPPSSVGVECQRHLSEVFNNTHARALKRFRLPVLKDETETVTQKVLFCRGRHGDACIFQRCMEAGAAFLIIVREVRCWLIVFKSYKDNDCFCNNRFAM